MNNCYECRWFWDNLPMVLPPGTKLVQQTANYTLLQSDHVPEWVRKLEKFRQGVIVGIKREVDLSNLNERFGE